MNWLLLASALMVVHNVDGKPILVNPDFVTTLHTTNETYGSDNKLIAGGHKCVIGFVNGKYISVTETCDEVRKLMEGN